MYNMLNVWKYAYVNRAIYHMVDCNVAVTEEELVASIKRKSVTDTDMSLDSLDLLGMSSVLF